MLQAILAAERSPDPNTQVGACLIDLDTHHILGTGYNGFPKGIHCDSFSWERTAVNPLNTKYPFIVHAEKNAINNSITSLTNAALYSTLHPCNECAKDIIQAGIKKVYYLENKYPNTWETQAAIQMFQQVNIACSKFEWQNLEKTVKGLKNVLSKCY